MAEAVDGLYFDGVAHVGATTVADARNRTNHGLDVVAVDASGRIVAIGEAKHTAAAGFSADLRRLAAARADTELVGIERLYGVGLT